MIDHSGILLALRAKLLTLSAVTTGSTALSATATGYERAAGSFITDGFRAGQEVTGVSFSDSDNNDAKTITAVATLTLTASGCAVEAEGTRTLKVVLPASRSWTNIGFTPTTGKPYVEEQYLPGPMERITLGTTAQLEALPMYHINLYTPEGTGIDGALGYADAILTLFAPSTALTLSGSTVTVRGDVAPFLGQATRVEPGWLVVPITVPLRVRTANSI